MDDKMTDYGNLIIEILIFCIVENQHLRPRDSENFQGIKFLRFHFKKELKFAFWVKNCEIKISSFKVIETNFEVPAKNFFLKDELFLDG